MKDGSDISETLYFTVDLTLIDNTVQKNFELQNARPEVVKSQFAVNKKGYCRYINQKTRYVCSGLFSFYGLESLSTRFSSVAPIQYQRSGTGIRIILGCTSCKASSPKSLTDFVTK